MAESQVAAVPDRAAAVSKPRTDRFVRHRGPITCVAGIPGKPLAVTSGYDAAVGIADFEQGRIDLLGYHRHLVNRVVVNSSGSVAATCSSDYTIGLWDLDRRALLQVLRGHWDDVEDFAFIDDATGVSVSRDRRILIWDLSRGAVVRALEKHHRDVLSVEYAKGKLYSSGDDMTLRQWDARSGELLRTWGPFEVETDTCAIDSLHDRVVLGCDDGQIRIFDSNSGAPIRQIEAHRSGIKKVAVSPLNGDILSAAYDQRIFVWDSESGACIQQLESHPAAWERSFNWSPDGKSFVAGTFDGTVLRWSLSSGRCTDHIGMQEESPGNACLNDISANESGLAAVVSDDGWLRMTDLRGGENATVRSVVAPGGRILMNAVCQVDGAANGSAGSLVLAGAHDQALHRFPVIDGQPEPGDSLNLGEGPINCIRTRSNAAGQREAYVACYSGSVVRVLLDDADGLRALHRFPVHDGAVKSLRLHPTDDAGVSCAADGSMCAWNFQGEVLRTYIGHTAIVDDLDFDPSGEWLASVSRDFTVNVYEFSSGLMRHSILLGRESPKCVLFWDRNRVFVGNYWGDVWRVDLRTEEVTAFHVAENGVSSLSRSGPHLATASYDGRVCLLDPETMAVISRQSFLQQKVDSPDQIAGFG